VSHDQGGRRRDLDVGGMHDGVQHQACGVDKDMPLLPLISSRIIAMRIDAGPPFSALFTLWLSITGGGWAGLAPGLLADFM